MKSSLKLLLGWCGRSSKESDDKFVKTIQEIQETKLASPESTQESSIKRPKLNTFLKKSPSDFQVIETPTVELAETHDGNLLSAKYKNKDDTKWSITKKSIPELDAEEESPEKDTLQYGGKLLKDTRSLTINDIKGVFM